MSTPILFEGSWSDDEEYAWVRIYQQGDRIYAKVRGHSIFGGDYASRREITQDEGLELMLEYADCETTEI